MPKEEGRREVRELVRNYKKVLNSGRIGEFSEADVGSQFIRKLLHALGWKIDDIEEVKEQRQTITGPVDYSLNLYGKPSLLVEIKRLDEDLDGYRIGRRGMKETHPQQAVRYAWSVKVDWVILTNFAETRLYYSHVRNPSDGLVFKLKFDEYASETKFDKLWIVSRDSVRLGELDHYEKTRQRREVDDEILNDLIEIREMLTSDISIRNPSLAKEEVNTFTQKILNRLLFMRRCEDSSIISREYLWTQFDNWQQYAINKSARSFMSDLKAAFRDFDAGFDGKLFDPHRVRTYALTMMS